jgi:hypothetical protein
METDLTGAERRSTPLPVASWWPGVHHDSVERHAAADGEAPLERLGVGAGTDEPEVSRRSGVVLWRHDDADIAKRGGIAVDELRRAGNDAREHDPVMVAARALRAAVPGRRLTDAPLPHSGVTHVPPVRGARPVHDAGHRRRSSVTRLRCHSLPQSSCHLWPQPNACMVSTCSHACTARYHPNQQRPQFRQVSRCAVHPRRPVPCSTVGTN